MNREQKAAAIAEIVDQIKESDAVFAVDFRGISVRQAADVRTRLRDANATFNRETQLLTFKGGLLDGDTLEPEQIIAISRLPAREVLYGQLVGVVASPITGLARGLNALLSGVAIALNEVLGKKGRGELPAGEAPAGAATA